MISSFPTEKKGFVLSIRILTVTKFAHIEVEVLIESMQNVQSLRLKNQISVQAVSSGLKRLNRMKKNMKFRSSAFKRSQALEQKENINMKFRSSAWKRFQAISSGLKRLNRKKK